MSLSYTRVSSSGMLNNGDWEEFGDDFEFEADHYEVAKALKKILDTSYTKQELIDLILQFDGDKVDLEDFFEEDLLDYFRSEAMKNGR